MNKLFNLDIDKKTLCKNEILLSNKIAFWMLMISIGWTIGYYFILPHIIWIPMLGIAVSCIIFVFNYFQFFAISRIITATCYTSLFTLVHALVINEVAKFFVPIYVVLIAFSLFSWNLFTKNEKLLLHISFMYNIFLICGQHTFNTTIIGEYPYDLADNIILHEVNYIAAVSFLYFSFFYLNKKNNKQSEINEKLIQQRTKQNLLLKDQNYQITQQQDQITQQNLKLQAYIKTLEKTKKELLQNEAKISSINSAIYSNFLIAEYDLDGKIIDLNDKLLQLIGLSKQEIIHTQQNKVSHLDLNTEIEHQITFMRFWGQIRRGESHSKEHTFKLPHKTICLQSTFAPILDENGNTLKILSINQDITHIKKQQAFVKRKNQILVNNGKTLMKISKDIDVHLGNWYFSLRKITKMVGDCLKVTRVSIWKYDKNKNSIVCEQLYLTESQNYEQGMEFFEKDFPKYFDALLHEKIIVAKDALKNDDTKEFSEIYLEPLQVKSMLDFPIFYGGELWGVIRCEQQYKQQVWVQEHATFIKSCCDIISLSISSYERKLTNQKLEQQRQEIINQNNTLTQQKEHIESNQKIIKEKNKKLVDSLSYAKRIQDAILPPCQLFEDNLDDYFILYQPKDIVSGDFYWFKKVKNKILIAAVDCTGHGVPGAFVSIVGHNALNRAVDEYHLEKPSDILNKINNIITYELNQHSEIEVYDGMDIALISIDLEDNKIEFSGAYNPLYFIENEELLQIKADRMSIGFTLDYYSNTFNNHEISLHKGQVLYLFSDGFADQFGGERDKKFTYKEFRNLLIKNHKLPLSQQHEQLRKTFQHWKGNKDQVDDILVIGIKI